MDCIQALEQEIRQRLDDERFEHTMRTVECSLALSRRFGLSSEICTVAALWHDVARRMGEQALCEYANRQPIGAIEYERAHPVLLHAPVAAHMLQVRPVSPLPLQLSQEAQRAIRWHTLGSDEMGEYGYVLFIADYIEPGRSHIDQKERESLLKMETLSKMMNHILKAHLAHLASKQIAPAEPTLRLVSALGETQ